jgi:hypothetical protein
MENTITITADHLSEFIHEDELEGFEGWGIWYDTDTGDFDSEKGAMCDYEIYLTSPSGDEYIAKDGYYTGPTGHCFYGDVTFELREKTYQSTVSFDNEETKEQFDFWWNNIGEKIFLKEINE